jgi:hypothetical protein
VWMNMALEVIPLRMLMSILSVTICLTTEINMWGVQENNEHATYFWFSVREVWYLSLSIFFPETLVFFAEILMFIDLFYLCLIAFHVFFSLKQLFSNITHASLKIDFLWIFLYITYYLKFCLYIHIPSFVWSCC